jgi:hypothetical protein
MKMKKPLDKAAPHEGREESKLFQRVNTILVNDRLRMMLVLAITSMTLLTTEANAQWTQDSTTQETTNNVRLKQDGTNRGNLEFKMLNGAGRKYQYLRWNESGTASTQNWFKMEYEGSNLTSGGLDAGDFFRMSSQRAGDIMTIDAVTGAVTFHKPLNLNGATNSSPWTLNGNNLSATSNDFNVGIGIQTPGAKLDVNGSLMVRGTDAAPPSLFFHGGENFAIKSYWSNMEIRLDIDGNGSGGEDALKLYSNNNNLFAKFSDQNSYFNGRLGIGTLTPTQRLDVAGSVKATSFIGDGSQLINLPSSSRWAKTGNDISYLSGKVTANSMSVAALDAGIFNATSIRLNNQLLTDIFQPKGALSGQTLWKDSTLNIGQGILSERPLVIAQGANARAGRGKFIEIGSEYRTRDGEAEELTPVLNFNDNASIANTSPGRLNVEANFVTIYGQTDIYGDLRVPEGSLIAYGVNAVGVTAQTINAGEILLNGQSISGGNTFKDDQGGSLEIGAGNLEANPVIGGVPYIDFHYGNGLEQDRNVRIINSADRQMVLEADIIKIASDFDSNAAITFDVNDDLTTFQTDLGVNGNIKLEGDGASTGQLEFVNPFSTWKMIATDTEMNLLTSNGGGIFEFKNNGDLQLNGNLLVNGSAIAVDYNQQSGYLNVTGDLSVMGSNTYLGGDAANSIFHVRDNNDIDDYVRISDANLLINNGNLEVFGTINATEILVNGQPLSGGTGGNTFTQQLPLNGEIPTASNVQVGTFFDDFSGVVLTGNSNEVRFRKVGSAEHASISYGNNGGEHNLFMSTASGSGLVTVASHGVGINTVNLHPEAALTVDGQVHISVAEGLGELNNTQWAAEYDTSYLLWVEKGIVTNDFALAEPHEWMDKVFEADYELPSLKEVEQHIKEKGHLHTMRSEKEITEKGYSLHDMNKRMVQTIEELTLHAIEQEKKIAEQNDLIKNMLARLQALEGRNK